MTAIFTFVNNGVAFVGADTRRAIGALSSVVTKVHRWSDRILLAQTGAGAPLTELITEMTVWRDRNPGLASFSGLKQVFDRLRPVHYAKAITASKVTVIGTIVVVCGGEAASPAQIVTFDFASGASKVVGGVGDVYADGTDQPAFQVIAEYEFKKLALGAYSLDRWAMDCIEQAAGLYPKSVGWPVDLAIACPNPHPIRLTVLRRVESVKEPYHPLFAT
jgi:hypothetical protein